MLELNSDILSLSIKTIHKPGIAVKAVMKKNAAHPTDSTRKPDVGETNILPSAAREDRRAYCVAL